MKEEWGLRVIISRTPFRISFAGGGSDLKEYYMLYGGAVLSVTINKYVYLSMHPYFYEKKFFLKYSKSEMVDTVNKIEHRIIKQLFHEYEIAGVDFNSSADIPAGTGVGSSSAFTVGLINLCNAYLSKYMSKEKIAEYACNIEINKLNEPIGKQDQYACAVGGINFFQFNENDTVNIERVVINKDKFKELQDNLLLFYLGNTRSAGTILSEQKNNLINGNSKIDNLHKMVKLAHQLKYELNNGNINAMGEILHEGWMYKKELASSISNSQIDYYYDIAYKNGAVGGKLIGAGGGGFLLFYVKQENHQQLRNALHELYELQFEFDNTGTVIIY